MRSITILATILLVTSIAFAQIQVKEAEKKESARRLEKIRRIAAESQGKIEVAVLPILFSERREEVRTPRESESARRLRKIQRIAAESHGKIEITVIPIADSPNRQEAESSYAATTRGFAKPAGKVGGINKGKTEMKSAQ